MDVNFWLVKCSACENSHATEVKCWSISQKKLNFIRKSCKINVKAAEKQNSPAFIFNFPAETIPLSKFYYTTDVVRSFQCKKITSFHDNESRKIINLRGFDVHFASFSV
jgi:hypothetical protein